jgi:DNA polymerase-4
MPLSLPDPDEALARARQRSGLALKTPEARRKVLHVDMDAFYASVEQRDDPSLRGKPVAVGGRSGRGVVAAASYEARVFGVHSAMPGAHARRLCPDLVTVAPRFEVYRAVSAEVRAIFRRYTDLVEPLSLDEAYLDVTEPKTGPAAATHIARAIREDVRRETGLACSAGVSFAKFLAKTASGRAKPDGLHVITPDDAPAVLAAMPVEDFHGVGPATAARLHGLGLKTGADLQRRSEADLRASLGKTGAWLYRVAHCLDDRPVRPHRERKSVGVERTFGRDIRGEQALVEALEPLAEELARRLDRHGVAGQTVTLKMKSDAFEISSRSATGPLPLWRAADLHAAALALLRRPSVPAGAFRLLGITASGLFSRDGGYQLGLPFQQGPDLSA